MRKQLPFLAAFTLLLSVLISFGSSGGLATSRSTAGTGGPSSGGGTETICGNCHNGGSMTSPVVTVSVLDRTTNALVMEYQPGVVYDVQVEVSSTGATLAGYGFQSMILNNPTDNSVPSQAGTLSTDGTSPNTQVEQLPFGSPNARFYAEQTGITASGQWTYQWTAPAAGTGSVTIYTAGNAVNGANGTGGDQGSRSPNTVMLSEAAVLPVELVSFTGQANKSRVELRWETAIEEAFSHFTLERRQATSDFVAVKDIPAAGVGSYVFTDVDAPMATPLLYRLRLVDLDGSFAYSQLLPITADGEAALSVYPNPAVNTVTVTGAEELPVILRDFQGREVLRGQPGQQLDIAELPTGVYLVTQEGAAQATKLLKR